MERHFNYLKTTMRYHLQPPEWLKFKRLSITSVGEKAEEGNVSNESVKWRNYLQNRQFHSKH